MRNVTPTQVRAETAEEQPAHPDVRPAFSSRTATSAFIGLILFLLALPILITLTGQVERQISYELMSEEHGGYSFMRSEIFESGDEIDMLFIGSSIQWNAIDTPIVQESLSLALGRQARVVSFGFNFNGIDVPYYILRDLLERKRVHVVVLSLPRLPYHDGPNPTTYKFVRHGEFNDVASRLPVKYRAAQYAGSVLRSPHDILSMVRPNGTRESRFAADLGANKEFMGMGRNRETFRHFAPPHAGVPPASVVHAATSNGIQFSHEDLPFYQDFYLAEIVRLLDENKARLVILNVPQYNERGNSVIQERVNLKKRFGRNLSVVGIAPTELFSGLSESDVELLHCDPYHFNANGSAFFTSTIAPALVDLFINGSTDN
jgi:hypothetical protein